MFVNAVWWCQWRLWLKKSRRFLFLRIITSWCSPSLARMTPLVISATFLVMKMAMRLICPIFTIIIKWLVLIMNITLNSSCFVWIYINKIVFGKIQKIVFENCLEFEFLFWIWVEKHRMSSPHEEVSETDSKLLVCNTNDPSSTNPDDTSQQVDKVDVVQDEQHKEEVYQVVRLKLMENRIIIKNPLSIWRKIQIIAYTRI